MQKSPSHRINLFNWIATTHLGFTIVLASLVGIGTGFLTVGFIRLIEFCRRIFFEGGGQLFGFLGPYWIILIPAIGGLLIGPIVSIFAPEARGHGIPEVMKAMVLRGGRIRAAVVVVKAVASALALGSGASVGREGPVAQIGAAFGSNIGQILNLSEWRIKNLLACGAAAGISAAFNVPIAGAMFALEVILRDFGARAISNVVVASVCSGIVTRMFLGDFPAFMAPVYSVQNPYEIFLFVILGVLSALIALLYVWVLDSFENAFGRLKFPNWTKPAIGGLMLGCIGFYFPQVFGSGYETIHEMLHGAFPLKLLIILTFMKILATSCSLGSGSSGGVFAPSLFIGAALGGALGKFCYHTLPFQIAPPGAYSMVGMASVFAGAAHAPVTAIIMIFEMTGDYKMILPIMVAVVISTSIAQHIKKESIYSVRLKKQGIDVEPMEGVAFLHAYQVSDAMTNEYEVIPMNMSAKDVLLKISARRHIPLFVEDRDKNQLGVIKPEEMQELFFEKDLSLILAGDMATKVTQYCYPDEPLNEAAKTMAALNLTEIPVVDPGDKSKIIGVLKTERILHTYANVMEKRSDLLSRIEDQTSGKEGTYTAHFVVRPGDVMAGKKIRDLELPPGIVFNSIRRGHQILVPVGNTVLEPKDKIWAIMSDKNKASFKKWLKQKR